jgi:hypothetical protein
VSEVDSAGPKPGVPLMSAAGGLDVKIAAELLERARTEGVSLVGQGGLLQQVTRAVLQAALEAEPSYVDQRTVSGVRVRCQSAGLTVDRLPDQVGVAVVAGVLLDHVRQDPSQGERLARLRTRQD